MSTKGHPQHLAEHVLRRRRDDLDLSQLEVWHDHGGPSNTTLTLIEGGRMRDLSRVTARKLDKALQWEAGSARRVWEGGEPTPLASADTKHSSTLRQIIGDAQVDEALRNRLLAEIDDYEGRGAG